jgi:S1-C subfamily serine protease
MQQRLLCTLLIVRGWQPSRIARHPTHLRASTNEAEGVRRGLESVVCVFSTTAAPDYGQPWALYAEEDVTGSGFWVSPTQVVTNEHVIKHARDVRVRPHGSARKLKCRVAFASAERDLALLEVIDDAMSPQVLNFAQSLPELYSAVAVVGYPLGGDNICVTRGVVSRLDAMAYGGEGRGERLLVVQIDAGVNSGTSGGPALDERGHVAGVAFSSYAGSADNIGYLVPASVVEAFLPV